MRMFITVENKKPPFDKVWNKVRIQTVDDMTTLNGIISEFSEIKKMIAGDLDKKGLKLSDFIVKIEGLSND